MSLHRLHIASDAGNRVAAGSEQPIARVLMREGEVGLLHRDGMEVPGGETLLRTGRGSQWPALPIQAACEGADGVVWAAVERPDGRHRHRHAVDRG